MSRFVLTGTLGLLFFAVSCKSETGGGPSATCAVTAVAITPGNASINVGGSATLRADLTQTNCSNLTASWSSSTPAVATVSTAGVVTGVSAGTAVISAAAGGVTGTATITVSIPACTISGATISPATLSVAVGDTGRVQVAFVQQNCSNLVATYSSANPAIATVSPTGLVTGVATGTTTITGGSGTTTASTQVTVTPASFGSLWTSEQLRVAGTGSLPEFVSAAWAVSPTDLYVSTGSAVHYYNGSTWSAVSTSGIFGLWGAGATDIFGVGFGIRRWNGSTWTTMTVPTTDRLAAVWGSSASQVFAGGAAGRILRFDGSAWQTMTSPTSSQITSLSGSGTSYALAGTGAGEILRWNGTSWSVQATLAGPVNSVWAASPTEAWAVISNAVYRYNGSSWVSETVPANQSRLTSVWGSSPTDVFVAGSAGYVLHYNGSSWAVVPPVTTEEASSITGAGGSTFVAGGSMVASVTRTAATLRAYAPPLKGVRVINDNLAYAVGSGGTIWRFTSGTWQRQDLGGVLHDFTDVWASSPSNVLVGGTRHNGGALVMQYNGSTWTEMTIPVSNNLTALAGTGTRVVGLDRFNGFMVLDGAGPWRRSTAQPSQSASSIWSVSETDFLIVGTQNYVARFDGVNTVTSLPTPSGNPVLVTVWAAGPSAIYAGTNNGVLYRFDGSSWTTVAGVSDAWRIWGSSASTVYTLGSGGEMGVLEGSAWRRLRTADGRSYDDLHGASSRLIAVGSAGAVLYTR